MKLSLAAWWRHHSLAFIHSRTPAATANPKLSFTMEPSSPSHRNNARKRASPHTTDNPGESQQSKRRKTQEERDLEAREAFEAPPEFYDRLSSPYLNRRMLAELERRTQLPRPGLERPRSEASLSASTRRRVRKFARHGGPNLLDIRGVSNPPIRWLTYADEYL